MQPTKHSSTKSNAISNEKWPHHWSVKCAINSNTCCRLLCWCVVFLCTKHTKIYKIQVLLVVHNVLIVWVRCVHSQFLFEQRNYAWLFWSKRFMHCMYFFECSKYVFRISWNYAVNSFLEYFAVVLFEPFAFVLLELFHNTFLFLKSKAEIWTQFRACDLWPCTLWNTTFKSEVDRTRLQWSISKYEKQKKTFSNGKFPFHVHFQTSSNIWLIYQRRSDGSLVKVNT